MKKTALITSATLFMLGFMAPSAFAAGTVSGSVDCQPIYGGGQTCVQTPEFEINKVVRNPKTNTFVDNLGINDPRFGPGQEVLFKLTVKNTSGTNLTNVVVKDVLPETVEFVGGNGTFDAKTRTLTMTIDRLAANESRDLMIQTKVVGKDKLPTDKEIICAINQSSATSNGKTSQDNAQFCIEKEIVVTAGQPGVPSQPNPATTKGGLPVFPPTKAQTTPPTGPEAFALIGLIPSALGGLFLRKKAK